MPRIRKSAAEIAEENAYPWSASIGFLPWKVTVYEHVGRKGTLYLQWREDGNWKRLSLQRPLARSAKGIIDAEAKAWAEQQAADQYTQLVAGVPVADVVPTAPLTITQGLAKAIDADTGKYPTDTPHRKEVERELGRAMVEWGADTAWADIKRAQLRKLWRRRILELRAETTDEGTRKYDGLRGAEITIARVLAVAAWLRDEELIPAGACVASRKWKDEMRSDWIDLADERSLPEVKRPRHTLDEMRRIMAKTADVDPRFELAMALGAELRIGQVLFCWRSHLDVAHAVLTVPGKGKKGGAVSMLTAGQMRVVERVLSEGYLRDLEKHCADYPLFPGGQMPGGRSGKGVATVARHATAEPIDRSVLDGWFHEAEDLAGVPKVKGRAAYGVRRAAVDAVKAAKISREGLQAHGGWKDTQVPDAIYADQEMEYAREEARDARAKIRGEE